MPKTEITYYEDEIYETDFQINSCKDYTELMKKYLKEKTWTFLSKNKIKRQSKNPPYFDIDTIDDNWLCSYFWELTQFLNKREIWLKGKMGKTYRTYQYIAPNQCKKPEKRNCQEQGSDENEIIVKGDNNEEKFRLKSDQFGFSVGGSREAFDSHPYGYLCELVEKKTENWDKEKAKKEKDRVYKMIAECIYHTRTLGAGFLWGKAIWDTYNTARGGSKNSWKNKQYYYIEDRVDLTLLEMKHLFEWIKQICMDGKEHWRRLENIWKTILQRDGYNYTDDILWCKIKNQIQKNDTQEEVLEYIQWLLHFGTFENYLQFFYLDDFGDFVDEDKTWMPFDIMKSKLEWDDESRSWKNIVFLEDPTEYKQRAEHSIYRGDRTAAELEQMLINVSSLTFARSYRMQQVIDGISN